MTDELPEGIAPAYSLYGAKKDDVVPAHTFGSVQQVTDPFPYPEDQPKPKRRIPPPPKATDEPQ